MSQLRSQFAKRLKGLRRQRRMTQEDLARSTGLSVGFIRAMEQAIHSPSFRSLEAIAQGLDTEIKELFDFGADYHCGSSAS